MPDEKRNIAKSDNGLNNETGNFNYLDNVGEYDEETVEAVRRACCFNFNNFIHSAQLMTKAMEPNSDAGESGLQRTRCNSGDSDLVVLSVVLNKKQKENDEVAMAIERLRQNGVNCVIFTMNDIRNGNIKPDASNCECFRFSTYTGTPKVNIHSTCSCSQPNGAKSEDPVQFGPISTPGTQNGVTELSKNLLINLSSPTPSPSPSPSPEHPASPLAVENNLFYKATNSSEGKPSKIRPIKKKQRRKRKYPYATRKTIRVKKLKLNNTSCKEKLVDTLLQVEEASNFCHIETTTALVTSDENEKDSSQIRPVEVKAKVDRNGFQKAKKKGRKTKGEIFEETFQIAVQSFVETTKEKHRKTRNRIGIPGVGRSMYTRSSANVADTVVERIGSPTLSVAKSSIPKQIDRCLQNESGRRKRGRPKKLRTIPNVKAICIRNIFIGPTASEPKITIENKNDQLERKSKDQADHQEQLSTMVLPGFFQNSRSLDSNVMVDQKNAREARFYSEKAHALKSPTEQDSNKVRTIKPINGLNVAIVRYQESATLKTEDKIRRQSEIGYNMNLQTYQDQEEAAQSKNGKITCETNVEKADEQPTKIVKDITSSEFKDLDKSIEKKYGKLTIKNHFNETRQTKSEKRQRRTFSPDITSRAARKKVRITPNQYNTYHQQLSGNTMCGQSSQDLSCDNSPSKFENSVVTEPAVAQMQEVKETLNALISSVVFCMEMELTIPESIEGEWDDMPDIRKQNENDNQDLFTTGRTGHSEEPPVLTLEVDMKPEVRAQYLSHHVAPGFEDSLPDIPDSMQLRRSSFYSLVTGNVRVNLEKYLDGRMKPSVKLHKKKWRVKNGFLLHHGDNCPEHPESPYKLHLATQVLLKLNRRRSKCKPKEERTKNILSYLKLTPKRSLRMPKGQTKTPKESNSNENSVFSGEWSLTKKYVCGVCGQPEDCFWDMVTHKGEEHPGVVVTHVELPPTQATPPSLIRKTPMKSTIDCVVKPRICTKCSATFSTLSDLHNHIFECAGNVSWLVEKIPIKRKGRRRGFKRRFSNTPKKQKRVEAPKRRNSDLHKCIYCTREFKTEGWLKNHMTSHSLPVSIPLDKLPLASLPVRACIKKSTNFSHQLRNSPNLLKENYFDVTDSSIFQV